MYGNVLQCNVVQCKSQSFSNAASKLEFYSLTPTSKIQDHVKLTIFCLISNASKHSGNANAVVLLDAQKAITRNVQHLEQHGHRLYNILKDLETRKWQCIKLFP